MVELDRIVPEGHARILLKIEADNPTGSIKDRMALAMIEAAEADGRLGKGGHVVEYTAGSTGVSVAFVCCVMGYPVDIVTSDAFSTEKLTHMAAFGAHLTVIESDDGRMDAALTRSMIRAAEKIQKRKGSLWTDQLNNVDVLPRYAGMADEIWAQAEGRVDAFVQCVGTGGSVRGIGERLAELNPGVRIVAVEPAESAVLSGEAAGYHRIDGVGAGFVVPLWRPDAVTAIARVSTKESMAMARRLAAEEGIFAGTSTGTNLVVASEQAKELGTGKTVVTVMNDTGMKYLSTPLYRHRDGGVQRFPIGSRRLVAPGDGV